MNDAIPGTRKSRGRPKGNAISIHLRLPADQVERLDAWIEEDGGRFSRPEAIRALLEHAWGRTVLSRGVKMLPSTLKEPG